MIKKAFIAIAVLSLFSSVCTASTVVFDNLGGTTTTNGTPSDLSAPLGGETVDNVTLATTTVVTGINWSGVYAASFGGGDGIVAAADDNFEIRIYADDAGTPGALLETFAVGNDVNRTAGIDRIFLGETTQGFEYSADINFTFNAGITHWLSVLNNTTADGDDFFQSVVARVVEDEVVIVEGGDAFARLNIDGAEFLSQTFATDFQLTASAVPEPSSVGILALGLMGLLTRRKRYTR